MLDGLAQFGAARSGRFAELTEPLGVRLAEVRVLTRGLGLALCCRGTCLALRDLLRTWLAGDRVRTFSDREVLERGLTPFLTARLREVEDRLIGLRPAGPLLAMPTHSGGWIDPAVLAERLHALPEDQRSTALSTADFQQALLRLAPGTIESVSHLRDDVGRILRFAIGSDDPSDQPSGSDTDVVAWVLAARFREPEADLTEPHGLIGALLPTLGQAGRHPGALHPLRWAWRVRWHRARYLEPKREIALVANSGSTDTRVSNDLASFLAERRAYGEERATDPFADLPHRGFLRMVERPFNHSDLESDWLVDWLLSIWPRNTDPLLAAAVTAMVDRFEEPDVGYAPFHAWLGPLLDPYRPWTDIACLAEVVALTLRGNRTRAAATDALIDAIESGRVRGRDVGTSLALLLDGGWAQLIRPAKALDEVSRVSSRHQREIERLLDAMLAHWGREEAEAVEIPTTKGLPAILQQFQDLLVAHGTTPSVPALRALEVVPGKGKAAKLAKAIRGHK